MVHGKVTLSSGREADWYIDMRRLTLHHEGAPLVGRVMRQLTGDLRYDVVGGLTLGADPVATAMLHAAAAGRGASSTPASVRKAGKAHGLQRRIEGPDVEGRAVLVVEDVSTTGGSPLTAAEALQEAGAEVIGVAVDRRPGRAGRRRGGRLRVPGRLRAVGPRPGLTPAVPACRRAASVGLSPGPGGERGRDRRMTALGAMSREPKKRLVVIGGDAAGMSAAAQARRLRERRRPGDRRPRAGARRLLLRLRHPLLGRRPGRATATS